MGEFEDAYRIISTQLKKNEVRYVPEFFKADWLELPMKLPSFYFV